LFGGPLVLDQKRITGVTQFSVQWVTTSNI